MTIEKTLNQIETPVEATISKKWPRLLSVDNQNKLLGARVLNVDMEVQRDESLDGRHTMKVYSIKIKGTDTLCARIENRFYRPKLYLYDRFTALNNLDKALTCLVLVQRAGGTKIPSIEMRVTADADGIRHDVEAFLKGLYGEEPKYFDLLNTLT